MKKATMKDVARMAEVTQPTVSHFLNGTAPVSEDASERIERAIQILKYKPNANARSLKTKTTNIIGLVIPSVSNGYYADIVQTVEEELREEGMLLFLCNTFYSKPLEKKYIDALIEQNVAGIIIGYDLENEDCYEAIADSGIPLITLDSRPDTGIGDIPSIEINNNAGGRKVAEHLFQIGARNICFASEPLFSNALKDRFNGFAERLKELGIPIDPDNCFIESEQYDKFEMGYNLGAHVLLAKDVDAIFASTDQLAYGIIRRLKESNTVIPGDIAVIGYDDNLIGKMLVPGLTTISQPKTEMARQGVQTIVTMIRKEQISTENMHVILEPNLIIRQTTME